MVRELKYPYPSRYGVGGGRPVGRMGSPARVKKGEREQEREGRKEDRRRGGRMEGGVLEASSPFTASRTKLCTLFS